MLAYVLYLLSVAAAAVSAAPVTQTQTLMVQDAQNKTMCPFIVETNIDERRIPHKINHIKCMTADTARWCMENHVPNHQCCDHQEGAHHTHCVQLLDLVPVTIDGQPDEVTVYVGCVCTPRHVSRPTTPELS